MPSLNQLMIFISAFAPGDEGAIYAYQLDLESYQLTEINRTAGMSEPFFMALAPNRKFLYAIHSPGGFGGESHEQAGGKTDETNAGTDPPHRAAPRHPTEIGFLSTCATWVKLRPVEARPPRPSHAYVRRLARACTRRR